VRNGHKMRSNVVALVFSGVGEVIDALFGVLIDDVELDDVDGERGDAVDSTNGREVGFTYELYRAIIASALSQTWSTTLCCSSLSSKKILWAIVLKESHTNKMFRGVCCLLADVTVGILIERCSMGLGFSGLSGVFVGSSASVVMC
jgi:hypothetical protein